MAIVAPITSKNNNLSIEIELVETKTKGTVLAYQVRAIDYTVRDAVLIEKAPNEVTNRVAKIVQVLISEIAIK